MKLQPQNNRILIIQPRQKDSTIILNPGQANPIGHWDVLAVAPDVTQCVAGDKILIRPDSNLLGVDDDRLIALADAGVVIAVVTNTENSEVEL